MKQSIQVITTSDGSHTLFVPELDEHYHSVNGAVQESLHVFINAGLKQIQKDNISIIEIGFGTGLNAFLSLQESFNLHKSIYYTGIELFPLSEEIIHKINYSQFISFPDEDYLFNKLHKVEWGKTIEITPDFHIKKINSDFTNLNYLSESDVFDVIFFDAFAPDKQENVWTQQLFNYLYRHTRESGVLVTYCAKGSVRRMLKEAGYLVERLPGPKGKREMLRGIKKNK